MAPPGGHSRLVEMYESAAHIHQVLQRFAAIHGSDPIGPLIPEISLIFEQLERIITSNSEDKTKEMRKELHYVLGRVDSVKRQRIELSEKFDQDLSGVIAQWRDETVLLERQVSKVKDEINKLVIQLGNRHWEIEHCGGAAKQPCGEPDSNNNEHIFAQVNAVVFDIKEDIAKKEKNLVEVHNELDINLSEIQGAIVALRSMKMGNDKLREDNAQLEWEKNQLKTALAGIG
ncbi:hypothetical protein BV898_10114 [Hypsibius exemplaris]|uniref:RH1 domain-containing protein n=1 Tax=Hypsibius exemplaris TaxID=2072580 RepID=A0A1W0WKR3_HYPEX|nr:hypothetical protein BV898_10114 [Hypsibius exemplaris]